MSIEQVQVEVCGEPRLYTEPGGIAILMILLHTTDPQSKVHAEISIAMHPASGQFAIDHAWLI